MVQRYSAIRRKKLFRLILVLALITAAVFLILRLTGHGEKTVRAATNEDRVHYLSSLGYDVEPDPLTEQTITLPAEFPDVLKEYNELQKKQGFDLEKLAGKEITMYTYQLREPETAGNVQCSLYIHKNRIVGGDIHSTAMDGFMRELK